MTDVYHEVMRTIWDHNLHFGLWTSEEDESPNRVAAERMTALHIDKLGARHGWRVLDLGRRVGTSAFRRLGVLRELARVVKPSGVVVVSDFVQRRPVSQGLLDELQPILTTYDIDELPTFGSYPKLLAAAGLQVVELLDLTAEARKTLPRMQAGARKHYDALVAAHGEPARQYLDQLLSPVAVQPSLGYVLAVARV